MRGPHTATRGVHTTVSIQQCLFGLSTRSNCNCRHKFAAGKWIIRVPGFHVGLSEHPREAAACANHPGVPIPADKRASASLSLNTCTGLFCVFEWEAAAAPFQVSCSGKSGACGHSTSSSIGIRARGKQGEEKPHSLKASLFKNCTGDGPLDGEKQRAATALTLLVAGSCKPWYLPFPLLLFSSPPFKGFVPS